MVNRAEEWLRGPANIKGAKRDAKVYVGRPTAAHNLAFVMRLYTMFELRNQNISIC